MGLRRQPLIRTIAIFSLLLQASFSNATTYFLSQSQGNDTNSGTTIDAPWKTFRKIYQKSISQEKFNPGDSILLKSGDTFDGPLTIFCSGNDSSRIIFGRYGSGENPIIYGDHPAAVWSEVNGYPGVYSAEFYSYFVQDVYDTQGTRYTKTNQGPDSLEVWLGKFPQKYWGYKSSRIYVRTPDGNAPSLLRCFEAHAVYAVANYVTIENLDIRNSEMGMNINGRGIITRQCSIRDTLGIGIWYGAGSLYGEIASNTVTRAGETLINVAEGGNHWIHHNNCSFSGGDTNGVYILGCHVPPREQCGIGLRQGTNNLVEFNSISHVYGSFFDYWLEVNSTVRNNYAFHGGSTAFPDGTGLKLHHNIFNVDGGRGIGGGHDYDPALSPAPDSGANLVFNNVVYNFKGYACYSRTNTTQVVYRNNIFVTQYTNQIMAMVHAGTDLDYNLYFCTAGKPRQWSWNLKKYVTLMDFQTVSGQEMHAIYADPQFVSENPVSAMDFKLKPTSPCISAGQNLKQRGVLTQIFEYKDYLGVPIPQGPRADIGPYEVASPDPPTEFRLRN